MSPTVIEALRLMNLRVRELITRLQPAEGDGALVNTHDFDDLRGELACAAIWLRGISPGSMLEGELTKEISDYRSSLEQVQRMLPAIQESLITKKVRLEIQHSHLVAAVDWANASKSAL